MQDTDSEITDLRKQIASAREERVAAQKEASALPALYRSLERVERDASSATTTEVEALKDRIVELREEITECVHGIDLSRMRVRSSALRYRSGNDYSRIVEVLNREAQTRQEIRADQRTQNFGLVLPYGEEVNG